jgi:predicted unusual protein kinase regulating ubiquinone biosynthesis (AarF/ABC1/UbiB family)
MNSPGPRRPRRGNAGRPRHGGVEACLARWNLLRGPRRLASGEEAEPSDGRLGRQLRGALAELGPVFSAFGLYLAARVDLLAAGDALELASLSPRVPPLPIGGVRERIASELGRRPEEAYAVLEEEPFDSRLLLQSHRGRLASGEPVIVRLVRADQEEAVAAGLESLPLVGEALVAQGWAAAAAGEVIADFGHSLRQQVDLRAAVQDLDLLATDTEVFGRLVAPAVHGELTTAGLITTADVAGISLGEALPGVALDPHEVARGLCGVWLRQALVGRVLPLDLRGEDVRVLPDGRFSLLGLAFFRPPLAVQADLREVLVALAFRDPDAAGSALLRQTVREEGADSIEQLRMHLRQIVPFRDGAWSLSGETLAEHLFLFVRTARSRGYRPRRALVEFCRGLFAVALAGRRLAPGHDPLREGLQDFRMLLGVSQVREALSFDNWGGQLDRYALLMTALPQRFDELLTRLADGGERPAPPEAADPPRRAETSHLVLAASLMVLAALALLLHHFVQAGVLAGGKEGIAAILFLAGGGILLWILARSR